MPKSTDRNRATLNGDDNKNEDLLQKQVQDISLGAQALRQQEDALRDSLKEKASEEKSKAEQKEDPQKINTSSLSSIGEDGGDVPATKVSCSSA